ncbi:MAG: ATP-binding protein, partial [Caulobacteraceae bacterium]
LLTGITASLEFVSTRLAQGRSGDAERYISAAMGAATRAAALTHRLLAFSRQQTLEPAVVDPNRLITGMEELIRRTTGPGIAFGSVLRPDVGACFVDPNQLENAILNLCLNARDAMPDGGQLTIETDVDEARHDDSDLADGDYVVVSVTDTGTGMSPEVAARAFDPFFTTKPAGKGTGLGLSMIYGFAKQSNGHVRVESQVGEGTTVTIYLPRRDAEALSEPAANPPRAARRAVAGWTVLVVEDEPIIRMLVGDTLSELGYQAIEAGDAASALRVLESDARVDLLITDFGLPGAMNGKQMADAARRRRPDLKVLFITGYADNAAIASGDLERGMHVLAKPFAMETLAARIQTMVDAA